MGRFHTLNPKNFQWISGDNTSGYIAQLFYLSDKWRFPLAANPNFGLDLSTSLNYSGPPLPLMLFQKLLRLNPSLQFIGFWLLAMMILQIYFGTCIGSSLGMNSLQSKLFGLLFITPFFLYRFQFHYWLTCNFLILWALWIIIKSLQNSTLFTKEVILLIILAYSINSYVLVMCLIVLSFPVVKEILRRRVLSPEVRSHIFFLGASLLFSYFIFEFRSQKATFLESIRMNFTGEYTFYPSNLLSILNPSVGYSRNCDIGHCIFGNQEPPKFIVPNFSILNYDLGGIQGNFEGFLYLGFGLLALISLSLGIEVVKRSLRGISEVLRRHLIAIVYVISISGFAITYRITIGSFQLPYFDVKIIRWALSPFRASSRFMWIVAYCLIIVAGYILVKRFNSQIVTAILISVLALQAVDLAPAIERRLANLNYSSIRSIPLDQNQSKFFEITSKDKARLVIYPPTSQIGMPSLAYEAWRNNLTSAMVQSSRINYALASRMEKTLFKKICSDSYPQNWLVVIPVSEFDKFANCQIDLTKTILVNQLLYLRQGHFIR